MKRSAFLSAFALIGSAAFAQDRAPLPPLPPPQAVPKPAADTGKPYEPQAILPGGVVVPLFRPDSPYLKAEKIHVPEVYNLSQAVPGRISSIVSIHNPSIEVHTVEKGINTGTAIIVVAGGGHRTLNVGGEAADFVPFFYNYGINTVILRNRLRADGYVAEVDAVRDAQQAVRVVRAYAREWGIDPKKIGVMGFSAGAELAAPAALLYEEWDRKNSDPSDPFAGVSSRPDFVGLIYPGPTPFARGRTAPPIPKDVPPAFIVCAGSGDRIHAIWALDYYQAMLAAGVPNVELHLYGNGRHPGDPLPDGGRMSGGLTDRGGIPFGTWQLRFIDWARDLGFLLKSGVETKAAKDVAAFVADPPRPFGQGRGAATRPADNTLTEQERRDGWTLLFDGKTTRGWMTPGRKPVPASHVEDGALDPHPCDYMLVFEEPQGDFELALDFKISLGCNSGVFVRTAPLEPRPGKDVGYNGIEVAIDDTRTAGYHDTGALYDLVAPKANAMKPAGEWNHARITCDRNRIEVEINGRLVSTMDLDEWTEPNRRPDGTPHKFDVAYKDHPRAGYIGLQDHGSHCWFKNIKLRRPGRAAGGNR
jgi:endo-1,4-beta-xylanase